jgi:hypothetical protein
MLTAGSQLMDHWHCPRERGEAKKQAPSNQAQWKLKSKAGQLAGYRADSGIWGQQTNLNCHTPVREELPLKDRKKKRKKKNLPNNLVRLQQSFCLNINTRTGCWRSNTRTTKIEILLFLNLEFFVCLFVLFLVCLFVCLFISPCWFLWGFFVSLFLLLFYFILLVLLLWVS